MRDSEILNKLIEEHQKKPKPKPVPAADDCEICGRWSSHLLDGMCGFCRGKYHLETKRK